MLVTADISALWHIDITPFPLAAVQDPRIINVANSWGGIKNYAELGLAPETKYFNTGLLVFDTDKWRKDYIAQKIIDCLENNTEYLNYPDQYGLNVVMANNWFNLNSLWNHFATMGSGNVEPYVIHFIERKPIYKSYANDKKFQDLFFHYLHLTEWKDAGKIGEIARNFKKLRNLLHKYSLR
jgi:lipopolysaccharide biosynthesis glycosyltransferase